jgi:UDP-glucose 4-epimerase
MSIYDNLIIGSSGYIGSRLLSRLTSNRTFLVNSKSNFSRFLKTADGLEFKNVFWMAGSQSPAEAFSCTLEEHPDIVNLRNLVEIVRKSESHLVFLSSGGCIYGPGSGIFKESSKTSPVNLYGELKLLSEEIIANNLDSYTIFRVANVFGQGQQINRSQGVIPYWLNAVRSNQPLTVFGSPHSYRDYIDIDSVIDAILLSVDLLESGIFNIGSGVKIELSTLISLFEKISQGKLQVLYASARSTDRSGYLLNTEKAESVLGWRKPKDILELLESVILRELGIN